MPHSYVSNLMHCVFRTKERFPFITSELEGRLWPYLGGIARENGMKGIAIGGTGGSRTCFVVAAGYDELCEGGSIDQRRIIEVGSRHV